MIQRLAALLLLAVLLAACTVGGTQQTQLQVTQLDPNDGASNVPVDVVLSATFDQDIDTDTLEGSFTLTDGNTDVAGDVAYDEASRTATFSPSSELAYETTYTATVSGSVATADGTTLNGDASWSFTTENAPPDPAIGGIEVTPDQESLVIGGTVQLEATATGVVGEPDESVTWSSDDETVATVDANGLVTAVDEGNATITATSNFDASVSGSAEITVEPDPAIGGIEVTPDAETLVVDDTLQLEATATGVVGEPDESVTWSSDDETVATVDADGLVTAVGDGTATITATSNFDAGLSDSAEITVENAIGGIEVSPSEPILAVDGTDTVQLEATATDVHGDPDESVTWSSDDETVATVDADGLVTAVAEGNATITATSDFDGSVSGSAEVTVAPSLAGEDYLSSPDAGEAIELEHAISGGAEPYTFAVGPTDPGAPDPVLGLPPGVSLDEDSGVISGTPTEAGFWRAVIEVSDASGQTIDVLAEIDVQLVLSYAQDTYTYDPAEGGIVVPGDDAEVIGATGPLTFSMSLISSGPTEGDEGDWTIDASTGAIERVNTSTPDTTTWTYEVDVFDDGTGESAQFEVTLEEQAAVD